MGMDEDNSSIIDDVDSDRGNEQVGVSSCSNGTRDLENAMKVLITLDLNLNSSSEKLSNLHVLLMHLLSWDNDLDPTMDDDNFSAECTGKALEFEYLSLILDSEVREVNSFLDILPAEIVDAQHKISSCRHFTEVCMFMEEKLNNCQESLKQSQKQVSEVKMQLTKILRDLEALRTENWEKDNDSSGNDRLLNINFKSKLRTGQLPRYVLRMLQKSLEREIALDKKLSESRQSEEDLKRKLHYTEQVAFHMEEAAEVVWGRFLEADNASEVLMGISKDQVGQLQLVQFNLNSLAQNEAALKSRLEDCLEQMKHKDIALEKLESRCSDYQEKSFEVPTLQEKVKLLGEQVKETNLELENANASYEAYEQQLHEMGIFVDSLKESSDAAESKAEDAEAKAAQLTETNLELTEELNFLKGSMANKTEKLTVLEKQLRDLEMQLQNAKVTSEASQEQQNMLYSAIWDMETLIEDLKSKVSKAESKNDALEEQCITLSESNAELNEELNALRDKIEKLEICLEEANSSKNTGAEEISLRTKVVMDMVVQLAYERERIQKQLCSLTAENTFLMEKLRETKGYSFIAMCNDKNPEDKAPSTYGNNSSEATLSEDGLSPFGPL